MSRYSQFKLQSSKVEKISKLRYSVVKVSTVDLDSKVVKVSNVVKVVKVRKVVKVVKSTRA